MEKDRVLIASPIRQKPEILKLFLQGLRGLQARTVDLSFLFVDDNTDEDSKGLLQAFVDEFPTVIHAVQTDQELVYQVDEFTHYWNEELTWKVARAKDSIIEHALAEDYDFLFLIDSDIVVHPFTIEQLKKANKPIISNIFWTRWQPGTMEMPQVWVQDSYTMYKKDRNHPPDDGEAAKMTMKFMQKLRKPGIYEVGGLGACTLLSKASLEAGARFAEIPNISYWGEDRHFCIRALAIGLSLHVDTHYPACHIYRLADIPKAATYLQEVQNLVESGP